MKRAAVAQVRGTPVANSTADRAIDVLLLFTEQPVLTTQEISDRLKMPRSTVYRYITSLKSYSLLAEDGRGGWRIGPQIYPLARAARAVDSVLDVAMEVIESLSRRFGETVSLYERTGHDSLLLKRIEATHRIRVVSSPGQILPWPGAASAKVLLAFAPPEEQRQLLALMTPVAYTHRTITSDRMLRRALAKIVTDGFAVSDQERHDGVRGIAAPVGHGGVFNHCVTLSGPSFRITDAVIPDIIAAVKAAADEVTCRLERQSF
jgi:DNA-binding IclR family transcriptional regulator